MDCKRGILIFEEMNFILTPSFKASVIAMFPKYPILSLVIK